MKFFIYICIPVMYGLFINAALAEKIYRWVDDQGNTHYGDENVTGKNRKDMSKAINDNEYYLFDEPTKINSTLPGDSAFGTNVTDHLKRQDYNEPFDYTVYFVQPPLLAEAGLYELASYKETLLIGSNRGLFEFDINNETLLLHDKASGLPGDKVTDIHINSRDQMFIETFHKGKNAWFPNGSYEYNMHNNQSVRLDKKINEIKSGLHLTVENSDILHNRINSVMGHQGKIWVASHGSKVTHNYNGGVAVLDPVTKRGTQYRTRDGLADSYCYDMTASEDDSVWVTHWKTEKGLSVLYDNAKRWQHIKTSANDVALGGVKITSSGQYLLIGQMGSLVVYDTKSKLAYSFNSNKQIANHVINDVLVDDDYIWATATRFSGTEVTSAALIKISRQDLPQLFSFAD